MRRVEVSTADTVGKRLHEPSVDRRDLLRLRLLSMERRRSLHRLLSQLLWDLDVLQCEYVSSTDSSQNIARLRLQVEAVAPVLAVALVRAVAHHLDWLHSQPLLRRVSPLRMGFSRHRTC